LRAAQDRKLIIQKQLLEAESTAGPTVAIPSVQLDELKNQLAEMKARYTDLHPDIVTIKRKIDEMEGKTEGVDLEKNPRYRELRGQLTAVDIEIPRYQQEEAKIQHHLRLYRARIENTPVREQEMTAMTREYQNTKASYETLLKKSQEAQQAENLEFRQKGEQFKVVDPARIPERPVRPDIPKVLLIGFVFGLAAATVSVIVRESIDHSFLDAEDVQITLGLKVLANIPKFENKAA